MKENHKQKDKRSQEKANEILGRIKAVDDDDDDDDDDDEKAGLA
jgi:hypothetical protein